LAELIKVFEVSFIQSVANDFNVEFVQIMGTKTVCKVRG
jgi:hypothetical protein